MTKRAEHDLLKTLDGVRVNIGLRQQGHLPTVTAMLLDGKSWAEIGKAINWDGNTARDWYEVEAARDLSSFVAEKQRCDELVEVLRRIKEQGHLSGETLAGIASDVLRRMGK